jgi:Putative phage abortive infection protein
MLRTIRNLWSNLEVKEKSYLRVGLFLILMIGAISIFLLPLLLTQKGWSIADYSKTGAIGDTINGIAGPFIALLAAVLTFLAFYIQYKANKEQREQFLKALERQKEESRAQENIWKTEQSENRIYELVKFHKANVDEMSIDDRVKGRICFFHMYYELRYCYLFTADFCKRTSKAINDKYKLSEINLLEFAYRIFYFGISEHSKKHFYVSLKEGERYLYQEVVRLLGDIQGNYRSWNATNPGARYYHHDMPIFPNPEENDVRFYYMPFDGHLKLGHYYRHLFQTAKFIVSNQYLSEEDKYEYIKMLRSQLTDFEQLLLYYNSLAWFHDEWKAIFTDYRLIKNIPLQLADFHITPENYFKDDIIRLLDKGIIMFAAHE